MAEKTEEKPPAKSAGKLILFNHSKNPYLLGRNADGSKRVFLVGASMECKDQAEFDLLRGYRGVSTTAQIAPNLQQYVQKLEAEKAELTNKVEDLQKQLEKFQDKKGKDK